MAENGTKEIKISFVKSKDFKFLPATGAWGGPNPQGEIVCNFFMEHRSYPEELKVHLDSKTGKIKKEALSEGPLIRELQVGIVMRPDIARAVGEWLVKQSDQVIFKTPEETKTT
jgi:hypothetical protein